jgi:hypothetical protein
MSLSQALTSVELPGREAVYRLSDKRGRGCSFSACNEIVTLFPLNEPPTLL